MRVVGLTRIALDEYPREAVREAVVNAIAHRDYEDSTRQILVRLFADKLEVSSPGGLMKPLTLSKLRTGNYKPCSRNPVLGQFLNHLELMEQRGSGIGRIQAAMLNHGLDKPLYEMFDGYFQVTLNGPGDNLDRLRVPASASPGIPPAIEAELTERHKSILERAVTEGHVETGWVLASLNVSKITAVRDLKRLCELGLLVVAGKGRGARYVPRTLE